MSISKIAMLTFGMVILVSSVLISNPVYAPSHIDGGSTIPLDTTPPTALCRDEIVPLDSNGQASITPGDVDDGSFDNDQIVSLTVIPNSFSCDDLGPNTVTLIALDPAGNQGACFATVTIEDPLGACLVIGGEMIPIETTALLLAGVQTNLAWIVPFALSAAGISIFLVRRK